MNEWPTEAVESSLWDKDARDELAKGFYSDAEMVKRKKAQPLFSVSNTSDVSMAIDSVEAVRLISSLSPPLVGQCFVSDLPPRSSRSRKRRSRKCRCCWCSARTSWREATAPGGMSSSRRAGAWPFGSPSFTPAPAPSVLPLPPPPISRGLSEWERSEINSLQLLNVGWPPV